MNFVEDTLGGFPASKIALVTLDADGVRRDWSFGELLARATGMTGGLADRGVGRGDVVLTLIGSRVEWVVSLLACWRMGAVALPCNPQLRAADLEHRVAGANPALAIADEELAGELPDRVAVMPLAEVARVFDEEVPQKTPLEPADLRPGDPALIVYTSGTTGSGRGVVHGQRFLTGQRTQAEHWYGAGAGDLAWCTAATGWALSARNAFVSPWLTGAAALLHDDRFDPSERLRICREIGVNVLCQAPTEYRMIAKRASVEPLPAMRRMVSAGEPLNEEIIGVFRAATGLTIADGYGQTETAAIAGSLVGEEAPVGSMGRPLPGIETRIEDRELKLRAASSPTFFTGYVDGDRFEDEWWATGDHVREDEAGRLWFEGRADDVIISSGYRIGPFEVESALVSHPAVVEAAAIAAPDEERGSIVRACVVLAEGHAPSDRLARELQEHAKAKTAPYKYPRQVEFLDELPKTRSGKIRRSELRRSGGS